MYIAIQFSSQAYYQPRKRTDGTTRVTQMSLPSEFYLPWSPWTLWHVFVLSSILQCYNFSIVTRTNDILLKYIASRVTPSGSCFFHIAVPSGFFSVRRRCVHSVRAVTDFLTYAFSGRTTSSKVVRSTEPRRRLPHIQTFSDHRFYVDVSCK